METISNIKPIHTHSHDCGCGGGITTYQAEGYDPTRTTTLRNEFARKVRKRFQNIRGAIRKAIVEEDVFGLTSNPQTLAVTTPGPRAFDFPRSADKVQGFMTWLRRQVDRELLEIVEFNQIGQAGEGAWTNLYVRDAYKRGVIRARYELGKAGFEVPSIEQSGGISASMNTPFHVDRLGLLYTRTFNELKGITDAMDQQISRVLAQGIAEGDRGSTLARKLNAVISGNRIGELGITDTLGRFIPAERRATILARTEIIRAHHLATIQEYRNWGVEGVKVKAEWMTAGDNRVCNQCASLQGSVFTLDKIEGMIPLHPQCRCIALPFRPGTDKPRRWNELEAVKKGQLPILENV
jgi:SPP1 gp7 family putative phage head morphogenesis protein